jgi:hypothetical protein
MSDAKELLNNPLVKKAAATAITAAAASVGVPLPPGAAEAALDVAANTMSSSSDDSKKEKQDPAPGQSEANGPKPENGKEDAASSQGGGFEKSNLDIMEQYGNKIIKATGADQLITAAPGKMMDGFNFVKGSMSPAPDTTKSSSLSAGAGGPLESAIEVVKKILPVEEIEKVVNNIPSP